MENRPSSKTLFENKYTPPVQEVVEDNLNTTLESQVLQLSNQGSQAIKLLKNLTVAEQKQN